MAKVAYPYLAFNNRLWEEQIYQELIGTILGCASIHLASQMGHTAIVAYLVAKRVCDVNFQVVVYLDGLL